MIKAPESALLLTSYLDLECKVYTEVLVHGSKEITIWFILRAINHKLYGNDFNAGKVFFSLTLLAETLNLEKSYVLKLLKSGVEKGYFQYLADTDIKDIKLVKLAGICKIVPKQSTEVKHQKLGTCGYATVADLLNSSALAIEIETQSTQAHSRYISTEEYKKTHSGNNNGLKPPAEIFDLLHLDPSVFTSDSVIGLLGYNKESQSAFVTGKWCNYGVSQETIAEKLGVSVGTVQRHLSKTEHARIFKADMTTCVEQQIEREEQSGSKWLFKVNSRSIVDNARAMGKVFKSLPSIYNLNYVLARPRCLARKVKRAVDAYNRSNQSLQTVT